MISTKLKYVIEVMTEDHPMYGEYLYDVRKLKGNAYFGQGRFCRDVEEVAAYLKSEEQKEFAIM